jgi:predicted nucleic acid-binding protein
MEAGRIIANAFRVEKIGISRLLRFASRRGIRSEIESIVKELVPSLQLRGAVLKEPAKAVIAGIRS